MTDANPHIESVFSDLYLFGGLNPGEMGIQREISEVFESYIRISIGEGELLVEVPDDTGGQNFSAGDHIAVSEIRTDIVGFVSEDL